MVARKSVLIHPRPHLQNIDWETLMRALISIATVLLYILGIVLGLGGCLLFVYLISPATGGPKSQFLWLGLTVAPLGLGAFWLGTHLDRWSKDRYWDE